MIGPMRPSSWRDKLGQQSQSSSLSKSAGTGGTGIASPIAAIPASTTGPPPPLLLATANYWAIATSEKEQLLRGGGQASNVEADTNSEAVSAGAHSTKSKSRTTLPDPIHHSKKKMGRELARRLNKMSGAAHDYTMQSNLDYLVVVQVCW